MYSVGTITYRLLSRALNTHVNTAKRMLHEYHKSQNALHPGSVHATYLVYGRKQSRPRQHDGDDVEMTSSMPEAELLTDVLPPEVLTLGEEENLEAILAEYQTVTSLHIYSLSPYSRVNRAILTDVSKPTSECFNKQHPTPVLNSHGSIQNPHVRRRDRKGSSRVLPKPSPTATKQEATPVDDNKGKQKTMHSSSESKPVSLVPPKNATSTPNAASTPKQAPPRGIMQSFGKAVSRKPPQAKPMVQKEEDAMALSDDGEADASDMPSAKKPSAAAEAARKSKKEREAELRRMMDEDEDEVEGEGEGEGEGEDEDAEDEEMDEASEPEPEPEPESKPESEPDSQPKSNEAKEPAEIISSTGDGRRRGRRRVMKKKRILDDQGYMVTIQESGWESFSEEETSEPPPKKATPSLTPSSSGVKAKKPVAKASQGSIMSFFSKK
ncbi:DNA polymerase subunit Cdc27 [Drechmeria coniospora]|uniref:DNA polymerase delta subunit 3 n=1 Tax=Drechmeria coniospora TaxID=98403 RepID=A0A151GY26_DRECN|nr:DNA polymerase subunit Cdc27 [Drechmeria coniospora]KYK61990.1 DNA polymerase subunit Cdc27 [Drechmeria coniospora]